MPGGLRGGGRFRGALAPVTALGSPAVAEPVRIEGADPPRGAARGAWRLRLAADAGREALLRLVESAARRGERLGRVVELGGTAVYLKGSPLTGRARARHGLRRAAGRPLPRLAEFENLEWLRARGFAAPRPLAAGSLEGRLGPRWQFLATELVEGAPPLDAVLERDPGRARELYRLAVRLAAGLHAVGFVHRDLYPRNLLVREGADGPRLVVLDAWRGGARRQLRGPAHDLGCLLLRAPDRLSTDDTEDLLAAYAAEREARGAPVRERDLRGAVDRARERERRRLLRDPARLRGLPPPPRAW